MIAVSRQTFASFIVIFLRHDCRSDLKHFYQSEEEMDRFHSICRW